MDILDSRARIREMACRVAGMPGPGWRFENTCRTKTVGQHQSDGGQDKTDFPPLVAIGNPGQLAQPADAVLQENRQQSRDDPDE